MDYNAVYPSGHGNEEKCDYCGAKFSFSYQTQAGHNEREEYDCPECEKEFIVRASMPIMQENVKLVSTRTDGRTNKYGYETYQDVFNYLIAQLREKESNWLKSWNDISEINGFFDIEELNNPSKIKGEFDIAWNSLMTFLSNTKKEGKSPSDPFPN